jgi:hypothetical protein
VVSEVSAGFAGGEKNPPEQPGPSPTVKGAAPGPKGDGKVVGGHSPQGLLSRSAHHRRARAGAAGAA